MRPKSHYNGMVQLLLDACGNFSYKTRCPRAVEHRLHSILCFHTYTRLPETCARRHASSDLCVPTRVDAQIYDVFAESTDVKEIDTASNTTVASDHDLSVMSDAENTKAMYDTASNTTVASDRDLSVMSDAEKTKAWYRQVISRHPVTVNGKLPTLDDVRTVIKQDYAHADEHWKSSVPKKLVSRYVSKLLSYTRHMNGNFELWYSCFYSNQCTKLHTCLFVSGFGMTS